LYKTFVWLLTEAHYTDMIRKTTRKYINGPPLALHIKL